LAALTAPVTVGMEATLYWQWLHDQLEALGHAVRVADARQVKLIWQARSKTDPIDARKLAELLRVNLFPTVWIPDADTRRRRQLLHGRAFLVRQRTLVPWPALPPQLGSRAASADGPWKACLN